MSSHIKEKLLPLKYSEDQEEEGEEEDEEEEEVEVTMKTGKEAVLSLKQPAPT